MFVYMKILKLFFLFLGLYSLQAQNYTLKNYAVKNGLPSNNKITSITQDNTGYLWVGSKKGLLQFNGVDFKTYNTKNCTVLTTKNDSLLIGTDKGLVVKIGEKFQFFEGPKVVSIYTTKEDVYVGTIKGLYILREEYLQALKTNYQIDLNPVKGFYFNGKNYWISTNKALWKLDKLPNPKSIQKIDDGNFSNIINVENQIVTTNNNGVFLLQPDEEFGVTIYSVTNLKSITHTKNQYWLTTHDDGITVLNNDFDFQKNINKYNRLATNSINSIFEDNQSNIWAATNDSGLYKFSSETITPKKPTIAFEKIEVVYKPIDTININSYSKTLQLLPNQNHVSFSFASVDINNPKKVEYRYKLGDKFSPWSTKNTVDFASLQSGNYTFTAQSKTNNLESKPIQFQFFIDKPIYKKSWFQWLVGGILTLLLGGYIFNYIQRIKRKNKAKVEKLKLENHLLSLEQKALQLQMNPHFIFNVLNGIKALGSQGKSLELNTTVSKFATLLRGVLHNSRQEEISLSEEINTIKSYIELEQQMSSKPFQYDIKTNLPLDAEEVLIPPMLLQPFVENSIKHGVKSVENGKIIIRFATNNNFLECTVEDNGIGFETSKKQKNTKSHQSVALKVTKERIESLSEKSKFSIKELKKDNAILGTRVWFKIPLKTDF